MGAINSSYNYKNQPKTMPYKTAQPLAESINKGIYQNQYTQLGQKRTPATIIPPITISLIIKSPSFHKTAKPNKNNT